MTKLEQAIKSIEPRFSNKKTISELAKDQVARKLSGVNFQREMEVQNHKEAMARISYKEQQLHNAMMILNGSAGYVINVQGKHDIISEFSSFEEVIGYVGQFGFEVLMEPKNPSLGEELYRVSENGMMTLIGAQYESK